MRTNIEIDDTLMAEARAVSGLATKRAVVEAGLRLLIKLRRQAEVKQPEQPTRPYVFSPALQVPDLDPGIECCVPRSAIRVPGSGPPALRRGGRPGAPRGAKKGRPKVAPGGRNFSAAPASRSNPIWASEST